MLDEGRRSAPEPAAAAHRPDLDGLRALAIIAVVIFHAFPEACSGGFVGVDIFFVISGFLISGIIDDGLSRGDFSLLRFYRNRIHRIFPALLPVMGACLIAGFLLLLSDDFRQLGKYTFFGAAFFENFALWMDQGYFDRAGELKPLRHLWSLAIEEQFYIFFPVLLIALRRRSARFRAAVITALTLGSLAINVCFVEDAPSLTFYSPVSRGWELFAGCLLRSLIGRLEVVPRAWTANGLSVAGVGLMVFAIISFNQGFAFPGWRALVPVLGAALFIAAGSRALINRFAFGNAVACSIGRISYPLYLWHWPLLSFRSLIMLSSGTPMIKAGLLALSVVLAVITVHGPERLLRRSRSRVATAGLVGATVVLGWCGWLCFVGIIPSGFGQSWYDEKITAATLDWNGDGGLTMTTLGKRPVGRVGGHGRTTLFWGDSHIEQYIPRICALVQDAHADGRGAEFLTSGGIPPLPGVIMPRWNSPCAGNTEAMLALAADPMVDTIVIGAAWSFYFHPDPAATYCYRLDGRDLPLDTPAGRDRAFHDFDQLITRLVGTGKTVYLVLDTPTGEALDPHYIFRKIPDERGEFTVHGEGVTEAAVLAEQGETRRFLIATAQAHGAKLIDPLPFLVEGHRFPGISPTTDAIYKDSGHLRASYARDHITYMDQTMTR